MKKLIVAISITAVCFLALGTFFDLQIDTFLYNPESIFGKIFAALGMAPQLLVSFFAPAMAFAVIFVKRSELKPLGAIIVVILVLLLMATQIKNIVSDIGEMLHLNFCFAAGIFAALFVCAFFAALPFAKNKPNEVFSTAVIGVFSFYIGIFILQLLKTEWGRQRFFTMESERRSELFTSWYLPQGYPAALNADHFKSFPSGHSFSSMFAVWFSLFPCFLCAEKNAKKYTKIIFALALIFGLTTMSSRLVLGRHFLSDVTMGASLSLFFIALFKIIVDANYIKIKRLVFK
ncbi:MAG: phosphatase PAP2 family protein [Spirochaetaceae bacterium]|jgi:membrane-associated phospholipid phosphatase|nr:phosphatase PAP2 family protein [Spirochaetaceae bacterium]